MQAPSGGACRAKRVDMANAGLKPLIKGRIVAKEHFLTETVKFRSLTCINVKGLPLLAIQRRRSFQTLS